jgi:hypothetical protein
VGGCYLLFRAAVVPARNYLSVAHRAYGHLALSERFLRAFKRGFHKFISHIFP